MKTALLTPSERLRPRMGQSRIDYANGAYVVRSAALRMDPHVTPGERRFDRMMERLGVASVWCVGVPASAYLFYWTLFEGSKIVYSFAVSHPFGL